MQLTDDDTLGAVDDEGAVLRHQRNVAEEYFLLLDVANALGAGFSIFVEDGQTNCDLQRSRVGHAALFALVHVILQLQAYGIAALITEIRRIGVVSSALPAKHIAGMKRVGDNGRTAVLTGGAKVVKTLKVSALTLPVADGKIDELQLRYVAKVGDRKDRLKNGLQTAVVALARVADVDAKRGLRGGSGQEVTREKARARADVEDAPWGEAADGVAQRGRLGAVIPMPADIGA